MDIRRERRQKRKEENKIFILQAAETVFAQKGFNSATMDDIASEAQFSKATIYRYFSGKGEIFHKIILNSFEEILQKIRKIKEKEKSTGDKVREVVGIALRHYQEKKNISRVFIMEKSFMQKIIGLVSEEGRDSEGEESEFLKEIRDKKKEITGVMHSIFKEGIHKGEFRPLDEKDACDFLESTIHGFYFTSFWHEGKRSLEKSTELIHNIFLHGIKEE